MKKLFVRRSRILFYKSINCPVFKSFISLKGLNHDFIIFFIKPAYKTHQTFKRKFVKFLKYMCGLLYNINGQYTAPAACDSNCALFHVTDYASYNVLYTY
jgi:hypothetical protein